MMKAERASATHLNVRARIYRVSVVIFVFRKGKKHMRVEQGMVVMMMIMIIIIRDVRERWNHFFYDTCIILLLFRRRRSEIMKGFRHESSCPCSLV